MFRLNLNKIIRVQSYLRDKKLLYDNVVHYPYKKSLGANYYVVKYIPRAIDYGLIDNKLLRH